MAALNKEEQQDLEITREMEDHEREWEDDDDDISEFQRTRPPVNMLNSSRRVDACFERLNRISEGTYGVVHRWVRPSKPRSLPERCNSPSTPPLYHKSSPQSEV